jgi:hypothetical protein
MKSAPQELVENAGPRAIPIDAKSGAGVAGPLSSVGALAYQPSEAPLFVDLVHDVGTGRRSRLIAALVLGIHRSGTSSVAGALVRLGGNAPLHLMPPQPENERGFWESPSS